MNRCELTELAVLVLTQYFVFLFVLSPFLPLHPSSPSFITLSVLVFFFLPFVSLCYLLSFLLRFFLSVSLCSQ